MTASTLWRWSRTLAALTLCALCGVVNATAAHQYTITPSPSWVAPVEAAVSHPDMDAVGGERFLLVDRQHYDDGSMVAVHHHDVTEIVGQAGVSDNSKLSIYFDPGYQRLELHQASVIRNGTATDRLTRARISVARTEDDSDDDLLNGQMTALVILPDIRVGDTVEVRYTVYGRNPVFDARHHSQWRMGWSVPVERAVLTISVPDTMHLDYTQMADTRFTERRAGGLRIHQWTRDGIEASTSETQAPWGHPKADIMQVSAYTDWRSVADWGAALFRGHASSGDRFQALSNTIKRVRDEQGIDAAIAMAIDHVQKSVRYYGLELGENSHLPHSPDEVLANGYGDCKDKALLLISLLDELDVDAWPLLVSSRLRGGVARRLPSPGVFNHAIVLVEHGGRQYWVDATDSSQAGWLGFRGQPEYGAGLVLGKPGQALIRRDAPMPSSPDTTTHDEFHFSSMGGPVDLTVTRVLRGRQANGTRYWLDRSGRRGFERKSEEWYGEVYGDLDSLGAMTVSDDTIRNEITLTFQYRLNALWDVDKRLEKAEFDAYATSVVNALDDFEDVAASRTTPLRIDGPAWALHRIQFYPNMASPERGLEETHANMPGFTYRDSEYVLGNSLVFDSEIRIENDELAAENLPAYRKFQERVQRNAYIGRYIRDIDTDEFAIGASTATLLKELGAIEP